MIDLRILRDRWMEDGARKIFAHLVNRCVSLQYPRARQVRPDPGDEGVDTFVGEFRGELRVWQSKFFCDAIGKSQKEQIRESWKKCIKSPYFSKIIQWTLCIPISMNVDEEKWWQEWRRRESSKANCQIEIWSEDNFIAFAEEPTLAPFFSSALERGIKHNNLLSVIASLQPLEPAKKLPSSNHFKKAIFVRKLEAAGINQHLSARTAFYNFELLRQRVSHGGTPEENVALEDLEVKLHLLWENVFNQHFPNKLGLTVFNAVIEKITTEDNGLLKSELNASPVHKQGGVHHWADVCRAGWTIDFEQIGEEDEQ